MTDAYGRWEERMKSGTFSMSQARQFGKAITSRVAGYVPSGARTNLTGHEAVALAATLLRAPVRLTAEADAAGLRWIETYGRRTFGPDFPLAEVVDLFSHFTYAGGTWFYGEHEWRGEHHADALPIWRVNLTDSRELHYWRCPWQSYQATDEARQGWWWA